VECVACEWFQLGIKAETVAYHGGNTLHRPRSQPTGALARETSWVQGPYLETKEYSFERQAAFSGQDAGNGIEVSG
jgi:hypothetical protein